MKINGCQWARVLIPMKWVGKLDNKCVRNLGVRNIRVDPVTSEIIEECNGRNLNIDENYYMEVLYGRSKNVKDMQFKGFLNVSDDEELFTKRNG